jgi:transposase
MLSGHERLRPDSFARMWSSLIDTGDAGVQILQAYTVR